MKKRTVGILTFHAACNYGAVLQAYAMKAVCEELGYEAHIVNYAGGIKDAKPAPIHDFMAENNKKQAAIRLCRNSLSYVGDTRRWSAFARFRAQYLAESVPCKTAQDVVALGYDTYISGSDQIWNYKITRNRFDPVYFGNFCESARQIVYAASAHDTPFPLDMELKFRDALQQTDAAIGIREQKLADYAEKLTGIRYPVVLDPVLLAGREIMERIPTAAPEQKSYILLYQIDTNPASDVSVKTLEKRFGCPVYTMTVPRVGSIHGRRGEAGPEEFLTLLKNARFLVTNSFHGIALSLLFEKDFFVYENGGVMSRIDSLLAAVGLHDRKVKMAADVNPDLTIHFAPVRAYLDALRAESMNFLRSALNGEKTAAPVGCSEGEKLPLPMSLRQKKDCSGCSACADVCPVGAIRMSTDSEGFSYPVIDEAVCIRCGKCDKVYGFQPVKAQAAGFELPLAFGIKHKNDHTRQTSRSGAAFVAFSDIILNQGGSVYGAAMADDFTVSHIRATTAAARDRMKTAKYVQSDVTGIYPQVAADLRSGMPVLFSGTPCQVAGLHAMLESGHVDSTRLVCCDLVCHGVPSPMVWKDYLAHIEEKHGRILEANFRDKVFGWDSHCESFVIEGKSKKVVSRDYTDLFYDHIMFRPSCHHCQFANVHRPGDLTLADFWGIEKNDPSFDDNRGVSLVLVSSARGMALLEQAKEDLNWFECDVTNCIQPTLVKPSAPSPRREQFWKDYKRESFAILLKKYTAPIRTVSRIKRQCKQILYRIGVRSHP